MNRRSIISNIIIAFTAQGVSLLLSFVQGLIIPKLLGIEQYGYWQLFVLYAGYAGLFDLGLNNGVYLIYGGKSYDELDRREINSQLLFSLIYQTVIASVVIALSWASELGIERKFVITNACLFFVIQNVTWFICYIFQAVNDTKRFSYSTIVERLSFLFLLLLLMFFRIDAFEPYVIAFIGSTICQFLYCAYHALTILTSGHVRWREAASISIKSIKVGAVLLIANLAGSFILGSARLIIDFAWGIETFGKLSFALSMAGLFLAFVAQASMVLFPALRQSTAEQITHFYAMVRDGLTLLLPISYLLYFPLSALLYNWLPEYSESLVFLVLLMPYCIFEGKMNILGNTLFKVRREERTLLKLNIIIVLISILLSLCGALVLNSIWFVIVALVVCIAARSIWSELYFDHILLGINHCGLIAQELVVTVAFTYCAITLPAPLAASIYIVVYSLFLLLNKSRLYQIRTTLVKTRSKKGT